MDGVRWFVDDLRPAISYGHDISAGASVPARKIELLSLDVFLDIFQLRTRERGDPVLTSAQDLIVEDRGLLIAHPMFSRLDEPVVVDLNTS